MGKNNDNNAVDADSYLHWSIASKSRNTLFAL